MVELIVEKTCKITDQVQEYTVFMLLNDFLKIK